MATIKGGFSLLESGDEDDEDGDEDDAAAAGGGEKAPEASQEA